MRAGDEGKLVHFVMDSGGNPGACRPALVTSVQNPVAGIVNLMVFLDGPMEGTIGTVDAPMLQHRVCVRRGINASEQGRWHRRKDHRKRDSVSISR